jgi:hypothetical protein
LEALQEASYLGFFCRFDPKMRIRLILLTFCMTFAGTLAFGQMRNNRLFKVDPAGFMFKELRVSIEQRILKDYFWYASPYGFHQSWLSRDNERYGRPTNPQKYYALGFRAGARRYFFPKAQSPEGFFLQAMVSARHTWMNDYSDGLQLQARHRYANMGIGFLAGYQKLFGPGFVPRKNFAYGLIGGLEFSPFFFYKGGLEVSDLVRNWYQFPFLPPGFSRFRVYFGVEVGFAFLQKHLHW